MDLFDYDSASRRLGCSFHHVGKVGVGAALIVGARAALVSARVERVSLLLLILAALLGVLSGTLRTVYRCKIIQTYGRIIAIMTEHRRGL